MSNLSTDKFYPLIREVNSNRTQNVECLVVNGKEMNSADDQRHAFADYYEDLAALKTMALIPLTWDYAQSVIR